MATDYNLVGFNPEDPTQLLIDAGRSIGVPSITETPQDEFMMHQALVQASYQAHVGVQGHQNFSSRAALTMQKFPGAQVSEICAESWPGQSAAEAAGDAYTCWKQSPGHWKECNRKHSVYGTVVRSLLTSRVPDLRHPTQSCQMLTTSAACCGEYLVYSGVGNEPAHTDTHFP
jgi:hypothetical protein